MFFLIGIVVGIIIGSVSTLVILAICQESDDE